MVTGDENSVTITADEGEDIVAVVEDEDGDLEVWIEDSDEVLLAARPTKQPGHRRGRRAGDHDHCRGRRGAGTYSSRRTAMVIVEVEEDAP